MLAQRGQSKQVFRNPDGSLTERQYFSPQFRQAGKSWTKINTTITPVKPTALAGAAANPSGSFAVTGNDWTIRFGASDATSGMLRLEMGADSVSFSPVGAAAVSAELISRPGGQVIRYANLWPDTDVEYYVTTTAVKENIVLKSKAAGGRYQFKLVGATLQADPANKGGYRLQGALQNQFGVSPINLILSKFGYVGSNVYRQTYADGVLSISVDQAYLKQLPAAAFPAVIVAPEDFSALPAYHVYASLMRSNSIQPWASATTLPAPTPCSDPADIRARSRAAYGRPLAEIEADFAALLDGDSSGDNPTINLGRRRRTAP